MRQTTLAANQFERFRKRAWREKFLAEMNAVVPWAEMVAVVEPYYRPKTTSAGGRPPVGLERMLRIHCLQLRFDLSDPAVEQALYDSRAMRAFVGVDLGRQAVPDETAVMGFSHLLEEKKLGTKLFEEVGRVLQRRGLRLSKGTIADATIIAAAGSTKNAEGERAPEMKQTRKGRRSHFSTKIHVGIDRGGLVHSVVIGPASEGDITRIDELVHGRDREIFGERAYWSEDHREHCRHAGIAYRINRRAHPGRTLTEWQTAIKRTRSRQRARGKHAFHVVKHL